MRAGRPFGLFEVYGLELEYMVVDRGTLKTRPIVDKLIRRKLGEIQSDVDNGLISWSNELSAHVIELKTSVPSPTLEGLSQAFSDNVKEINRLLESDGAGLLPTAAHPLMDPYNEAKLWEHEYNEIYEVYNKIFDCRGHGWSNVQSFHLNLPFRTDNDFEKLHAAVRLILPIIPALSASSPILDGKVTGMVDSRMDAYLRHQDKMPSLMGKLIPEQVFTEVNYNKVIFDPIVKNIRPYDTKKVMEHHFLNSRGAIARFDRGAIEIRVIDVQECPAADLAICGLIVETLKALTGEKWSGLKDQKSHHEDNLRKIFDQAIQGGLNETINDPEYLRIFGITTAPACGMTELWQWIYQEVKSGLDDTMRNVIEHILNGGNLSQRILKETGSEPKPEKILEVYQKLATCLENNIQLN